MPPDLSFLNFQARNRPGAPQLSDITTPPDSLSPAIVFKPDSHPMRVLQADVRDVHDLDCTGLRPSIS